MRKFRFSTAAAGAVALTAVAVLGGASPSSAADTYIVDGQIGVEGEAGYPDGWFTGNPQPTTAEPETTEAGLVLLGKVQLLHGGVDADADLDDLVENAAVVADGTWTFQIPVFLDGEERTGFTTFRPVTGSGVTTESKWYTSQAVGDLTPHVEYDFDQIVAAFEGGENPTVLAHGILVETDEDVTLQSITWDGDTSYFTPIAFNDIADNTFQDDIEWLVGAGITTGYDNGDGTFSYRGSDAVLREQMAAFLYRYDNDGANPPALDGPSDFLDVPRNHVFKAHIAWLAGQEITTGYDDGTFRPGQPVLREQMAAFLYRLAGSPEVDTSGPSPFTDVLESHTFYKEIVWLESTGITEGYIDDTFRGSEPVLREQMAAFLNRFDGLPKPSE